jgi:enoyl-CoA hydratase/carnithine racemase
MIDRFRTMPKATIGKIEGRARGGGSELLLSLDIRFAAIGRAISANRKSRSGSSPAAAAHSAFRD